MDFLNWMTQSLEEAGIDTDKVLLARRVAQVQGMWKGLVEQAILDHTNAVYLFTKDGMREMHVYVDDSIFAAELNNRRELLVMHMKQVYGEDVDKLLFHISRGARKSEYPFRNMQAESVEERPLSEREMSEIERVCAGIEDEEIRKAFREAMISDLQRKKPENN